MYNIENHSNQNVYSMSGHVEAQTAIPLIHRTNHHTKPVYVCRPLPTALYAAPDGPFPSRLWLAIPADA